MTRSLFLTALLFMALFWPGSPFCAEDPAAPVRAVRVAGVINPVIADFITAELAAANAGDARAFLIELDTPGVSTADYTRLPFEHIPRPIFPLDPEMEWQV